MNDCRWKAREELTEWEDREAAQLASAQQIHFVGPQISQCYVSQNPQLVFAMKQQQVLTAFGARSKWIAVQVNTPTGADLERILLLIHLSSLFSLFNEHLC